jgi:hypothetical protein
MPGDRPANPSSVIIPAPEAAEADGSVEAQPLAGSGSSTTIGPQFLATPLSAREHAERLQILLSAPLENNHQEIYFEVTSILLFYSVQEVNSLFSEYLALTQRNLHDEVLLFFVKCQALNIAVPVTPAPSTAEHRFSNGIFTFSCSFIVAESLDLYLDNLNLPIFVSLFGALAIAFFAEWILQPYVKGRLK